MSDGGDFDLFSRQGSRTRGVALGQGGAATLSSLCFQRAGSRGAVDDAGLVVCAMIVFKPPIIASQELGGREI
jgi:hypothetical protein